MSDNLTGVSTPRQTKKSNDFTGRQAAELAKKSAEDRSLDAQLKAERQVAEQTEFATTVFDSTKVPSQPTVLDEVVDVGVTLADDARIVRLAEDVENMTYGYGNTYTFKAGGRYKVPLGVAERLNKLGMIWH